MGFPMEEQARRKLTVTVEYDHVVKGKIERKRKQFPTMQAAKKFYTSAFRDGLNPKVISTEP